MSNIGDVRDGTIDADAVDKVLDEIARLQEQADGSPNSDAFWTLLDRQYIKNVAAVEFVSADDAAFERDLMDRYPSAHQWPDRERERAIRADLILDEPVDDEDDGLDWPDDLAS